MSDKSAIEWTDATWNPVRGCTKVSAGCKNCYAETFAERWRGIPAHPYEQGFDLRLVPEKLDQPLRWTRPRKIFVNSMSDLFHEGVSFEYIAAVFGVIAAAKQHTFQLLTKRPERMDAFFKWVASRALDLEDGVGNADRPTGASWEVAACAVEHRGHANVLRLVGGIPAAGWPLSNVLIGTSVEDARVVHRIDELRNVPAATRFLSIEPLIGPVGQLDLDGIGWVIVGGESGPGARPMEADWVRSIRDQCVAAGVPFFFKQWGGVRKKEHGRELDGRTWDEFPAFGDEVSS